MIRFAKSSVSKRSGIRVHDRTTFRLLVKYATSAMLKPSFPNISIDQATKAPS
jgi:hypothetical protein